MWSRVGGEMRATHTHRATAEMDGAATHTHSATATAEVSATAATTEVTAPTTAADMSTASAAAETAAASGIGDSRQTKGKAYCSRACCYFPHDTTSSSGPMRKLTPRSTGPFPRTRNWRCCNAHVTAVHLTPHSRCG
jgi:hypothetical protein